MSNNASDKKSRTRILNLALIGSGKRMPHCLERPLTRRNGKRAGANGDAPRFVAPTHGGVDILKLLTELEDLVENTRKVPVRRLIGFDEDKFHMTIMKIRANLPEEMKRASKLARDQERIVEETRRTPSGSKRRPAKPPCANWNGAKKRPQLVARQARAETEQQRTKLQCRSDGDGQRTVADARATRAEREARQILEEAQGAQQADDRRSAAQQAAQLVSDNEIVQQAQVLAPGSCRLRAPERKRRPCGAAPTTMPAMC